MVAVLPLTRGLPINIDTCIGLNFYCKKQDTNVLALFLKDIDEKAVTNDKSPPSYF
jgi:hypothetical protein